jgi:hypothetical protein
MFPEVFCLLCQRFNARRVRLFRPNRYNANRAASGFTGYETPATDGKKSRARWPWQRFEKLVIGAGALP